MRMVYDAWREHERYEDMDEFDKFLVDEYRDEKLQEVADKYEEQRSREDAEDV